MRALVKWLTGRDSGTYTPDVLLDWVVDYEECTPARSNVVEWRQPPKPKSGWPVFDAVVIAVSGEFLFLIVLEICIRSLSTSCWPPSFDPLTLQNSFLNSQLDSPPEGFTSQDFTLA